MDILQSLKTIQRGVALGLIGILVMTLAPWAEMIPAFAQIDAGDDIKIISIDFTKEHNGLEMSSAYVQIIGSGLSGKTALFEKTVTDDPLPLGNGGFQAIGTKVNFGSDAINSTIMKYTFTAKEAQSLTGKVLLGNRVMDLNLGSFPNINKLNLKNVNVTNGDDLVMEGNNLNTINGTTVTATFGRDIKKAFVPGGGDTASKITLTNPAPESSYGYQDIDFTRSSTISFDATNTAPATVKYTYAKAFRFTQNVGLTGLEMYPDIGATGDFLYLTADTFPPANYQVYLLKKLDGTEEYSSTNRATTVNLDAVKKQLVVQIPASLGEGDYNVVLTRVENNEVVAEQIVMDGTDPDVYTVVDSLKKLKIEQISPTTGPDTGVDVTVVAKNMINMNIPGLNLSGNNKAFAGEDSDQTLRVTYDNGTFNSKPVSVVRKISIFVGNKATFQRNGASFDLDIGTNESPDKVSIRTAGIDDVLTDPIKDVLIETETTLTATDGSGKVYVFKQSATLKDSFTFIPSTLTPTIDTITPDKIQVETTTGSTHKLKQDTLLVIKGSKFSVYKKVNSDGSVELKKPSVFIKGVGNISESQYQVAFLPNVSGGIIKTKVADADAVETIVKDADNNNIKLELTVLNSNDEVVDGTVGNEVGNKIIIRIPDEVTMKIANVKKNIQISNPRLGSEDFGSAMVKYDAVEIITTSDYPIIENVVPNVVSVDGGVEAIVRGTNFANGVKVYLDGEEVAGVTREVDTSGDKINLKFDVPPGRVGMTQLQVMNPSGGLAVWDFIYVKSFDKDPTIDSFSPTKGIYGTLVSVNGDNYLKPDPTAPTNIGLDAFRLIGSKIYLDGKDVNIYNADANGNLQFLPYAAPLNEVLITRDGNNKTAYSPFYKNAYVYSYDNANPNDSSKYRLYYADQDEAKRPVLTDRDQRYYVFRYNTTSSQYEVFDKSGNLVDNNVSITFTQGSPEGITDIEIDDPAVTGGKVYLKGVMNNNIIRKDMNPDGTIRAKIADYSRSIILREATAPNVYSFFTLSEDFEGSTKLTNGKDKVYKVVYEGNVIKAVPEAGAKQTITLSADGTGHNNALVLNGVVTLNFTTAYKVDGTSGIITGNRTRVVSKDQILFTVPVLASGTGYKNLAVVNPDTKRDEMTGNSGFYYVSQAGSYPVITQIDPAEGSDEGGYTVTIRGSDFQDGVKVIVDSQVVPDKDVFLALDGKSIAFTMPKSIKDLKNDYGVDRFTVPIVVLNSDGASDSVEKGFTYIKPSSIPKITKIIADNGSANGNEIVEIFGSDFRFFEPFKDADNDGSSYEAGDIFTDLNGNGKWDNYLTYLQNSGVNPTTGVPYDQASFDAVTAVRVPDSSNPYHTYYYNSKVFPRVFFGSKEAKIVHFGNGYIKVISPASESGPVNLYVVNNDSGITNKAVYTYKSSNPKLSGIIPSIGRKMGQELKELYGTDLYRSSVKGYYDLTDAIPVVLPNIGGLVRFGDVDNREIERSQPNSGLINNGQSTVNLTGGLKVTYSAEPAPTLTVQIQENGKVYTKVFAYDNSDVFIPMGMLSLGSEYYAPSGYTKTSPTTYDRDKDVFEYVRVNIEDRRLFVERGYAPKVVYDNPSHVTVMTPSYYTIDTVPVTYTNPDGGKATTNFTYTNPASQPKIYDIKPKVSTEDNTGFVVEGSVKGGWEFEIRGEDFREGATVSINGKAATVVEITKVTIPDPSNPSATLTLDNIIVKVPAGGTDDLDKKYPIFVENTDKGIANSTTLDNRIGPDAGKPIYFTYRKPLSDPVIKSVTPEETSVAGGNTITIKGSDFRAGASVIVGSKNGVPMPNVVVSNQGTTITFTTPTNLTLGDKSVTVQNSDFGSVTLSNALTIVSAPEVNGTIYDADGVTAKNRISLEGGEEIVLKGTGFMEGAKVFFGNAPVLDNSETPTGNIGLYIDDKYYKLENVVEGTSVTYVDENTLKVKTPERLTEGKVSVTVINPDKGISSGSTELIYTVPVPSDPVNLQAEVIAEQYIRLYGYTASKSEYYEIYYYIGSKNEGELRVNSYKDFQFLNNTDKEPYRITRLPGLENIKDKQFLYFVIKAVNKFGASNYSNMAIIPYAKLKDITQLGQKDIDGEIGVPTGKTHTHQVSGNTSTVQLSAKVPDKDLVVTIDRAAVKAVANRVVNVPQTVVFDGRGLYTIQYGDSTVQFMPQHLNTDAFRDMSFDGATYGQMATGPQNNAYGSALKVAIGRGLKAVSPVFSVTPYAVNNNEKRKTTAFNGNIDFGLSFEGMGLSAAEEKNVRMYRYDSAQSKWVMITSRVDTSKNMVFTRVNRAGEYILLVQK